jgi:two-component system sensor histidine kinase YesM
MRIKPHFNGLLDAVFNNTKLRPKLIISYLIAVFVPLLLTGVFLILKANQIIEDQSNRTYGVSMEQLIYNIETRLASYEELANHFYFDIALNSDLQKDYSESPAVDIVTVEDAFIQQVKAQLKFKSDLRAISIYYFNDHLYNAHPFLIMADDSITGKRGFQESMASGYMGRWGQTISVSEGSVYWAPNKKKNAATTSVFSYNRPLGFYNERQPAGLLTLEIKESDLYQLLAKESGDKNIFLLDPDGRIITSNKRESIGDDLEAELYERIKQDNSGEFLWTQTRDHYKVMYSELKNGWKMIYMISVNQLMEETRDMSKYGLMFILGSMILSVALIVVFSNLIVSRMTILLKRIQRMRSGEIEVGQFVNGNDEIAVLDRSFNQMAEQMKYLIDEVFTLSIKKKEAELTALQSQINPHFLYNTLSTVSWLGRKNGNLEVCEIVESLATFYRISLSKGKEMITIREEFECIKAYMDIQRYRQKNRVRPIYRVDEGIMKAATLKLIMQPIIENAILHGLSHEKDHITILMKGSFSQGGILLEVTDDGVGMAPDAVDALFAEETGNERKGGYGLRNVNERIKLHFGNEYGVTVKSAPGEGTSVYLHLPFA